MQGALFCYPEKIFTAPFWDNPNILQNNKAVKKLSFINISSKIKTISDFYEPETSRLFTKDQFENAHNLQINNDDFIELNYIIKSALRKLGLQDNHDICTFLPSQPLLIDILSLTKKGCSTYSKLLRKKSILTRNHSKPENKWHRELGCTFGIEFWNKTYCLTARIKQENKLRWFQYQINRNSLFTNYRVNKFKSSVSPLCTFCSRLVGVPHPPRAHLPHLF